ncbi:hypothetical protein LINPERPRIM_LOCUS32877 [Linum perenne]
MSFQFLMFFWDTKGATLVFLAGLTYHWWIYWILLFLSVPSSAKLKT